MANKAKAVVLVVEDNELLRPMIVTLLDMAGHEVLQPVDGPSGLKILQSGQKVDLLISDVRMPGMNGDQKVELAWKVRPELKVLFLTGYKRDIREDWVGMKEVQIMNKPFPLKPFLDKVQSMLTGPALNAHFL